MKLPCNTQARIHGPARKWRATSKSRDFHHPAGRITHEAGRFSPEYLLVATAEACPANYIPLLARLPDLEIGTCRSGPAGKGSQRFRRIVVRPVLQLPGKAASLPKALATGSTTAT